MCSSHIFSATGGIDSPNRALMPFPFARVGIISSYPANITDPVRNFPPWSHERLVIQDPFLVTHNHAASLSKQMVVELQGQIHQTNRFLIEGRPLCSMYGTHATPPGSDAEAKILAKPQAYSAALGLLEQDRVPAAYRMEVAFANNPEIRDHISPDPRGPTWGSRRWFHASSVSPGRKKPFKNRMTPPKPIKEQDPAEYQEAWGLNSPVHKPSFWRPAPVREPLTLPTNSSAMHPVMHVPATEATNLVPPVRATKAGIAYKSMLSRRQGFHTTAYCAARGARAPPPEDSETQPSLAIDASVLASRNQTLFAVQDAIQKGFGQEYKVEIFGSTRYGVSSANSDLDMVVLDPYQPYGAAPGYEWDPARKMGSIYDMGKVAKKLRKAGFWIFETLPTASVPIVKFTDRNTGHDVDLNINDRLGVLNSDLIKRYCELNPVLIPMIRYIKLWAKPLGLNSPGRKARNMPVTFSSYALSMLTIGFLQYRGLLPNLQADLPPLEPGKLMGTFWLRKPRIMCCDVRYSMGHGWTPPEDPPVHQLMQEWFQFYGQDFNYKDEMISIRQGGRIPRPPRVPDRVSETFTGVFWNIDPFIRSKNITQNIARFTLSRFVKLCGEMASKEEFRRGVLPRLPPPRARQEKQIGGGLDDLMPPAEMRRAEFTWVPKDGFPSAWTKNKLNTMKKRKLSQAEQRKQAERAQRVPPPDPDANWVPFEDAVPFGWNNAQQTSTAPANTPEKASPVDEGVREEGAPPPPDTSKLDYDPTLRFDEFGRYMAPKPRRKVEPEEPEEDQIGFGLR
ncbi:hypothetical protein K438DRAFT_635992 [Mycena galopus ATCC 62051]|nr:hypothetical protein K438DRAFT_635992 [Mycena galopus ATCC 62051]